MSRRRVLAALVGVTLAAVASTPHPIAGQQAGQAWKFAVSGDSRNCGDVVMPAIAVTATTNQAAFYWHLGDLRYSQDFDEDMKQLPQFKKQPMSIVQYMRLEWPDFIEHQIKPFGSMPYYIGIGNHETVFPRTRLDFIQQFGDWLVTPTLKDQRLKDDPNDHMIKTYYHWVQGGVAFYNLDNATEDMFDRAQIGWFNRLLAKDVADPAVRSIVVGVHSALPDSIAADHSMSDFPVGVETGRAVYKSLLNAQNAGKKRVYVLASHLHNFIDGVYNTAYWRANGGVLPGWIVGTAGAYRLPLPAAAAKDAKAAMTMVYGSLIATVQPDGAIQFDFKRVNEPDVPPSVVTTYGKEFVHWCFANNTAGRSGAIRMPVARRTRSVAPAIAASTVSGSSQGDSGG